MQQQGYGQPRWMDANRHPTKGLWTPKMEEIHKINYIKRTLAKVPTIPKKKSPDNNIFDSLKRYLLSFKNSFVSLSPNSPKIRMWDQLDASLFNFPTKSTLSSQKMIPHIIRNIPRNPKQLEHNAQ